MAIAPSKKSDSELVDELIRHAQDVAYYRSINESEIRTFTAVERRQIAQKAVLDRLTEQREEIANFRTLAGELTTHIEWQTRPPGRIFSGDASRDMWKAIRHAKSKSDLRSALYFVCCRIQELESKLSQD